MNGNRQQAARTELRTFLRTLLTDEVIRTALARAQEVDSAELTSAVVWPRCEPAALVQLDNSEPDFLLRAAGVSASFENTLTVVCFDAAEAKFATNVAANPYYGGARLHVLVRQEIKFIRDNLHRRADGLFDRFGTDRFASAEKVRDLVKQALSDRCLDELLASVGGSDDEPKRHLKILTALVTRGGDRAYRNELFTKFTNGKTATFPFVLKYLNRGTPPSIPDLPGGQGFNVNGFTPELLQLFPESAHVQTCLNNFGARRGVLETFLPADAPIRDENREAFQALPAFVPREQGGLLLPREVALQENRRDRYRMPDGAICCVGLGITLESVLFQLRDALVLAGAQNARGNELLRRLRVRTQLRDITVDRLQSIFSEDSLSLRDALAHGAFFANNETRVEEMVSGLSWALADLMHDVQAAGIYLGPHRWDAGRSLNANDQAIFEQQLMGRLNLIHQADVEEMRQLIFRTLNRLAPDKALLGKFSFILWNEHQGIVSEGRTPDATGSYIGLLSALIVLEELFRAAAEERNVPILLTIPDSRDRVRCDLSILDDRQGRLLAPAVLNRLFGVIAGEESFRQSLRVTRVLRDFLLHGNWLVLRAPWVSYSHLVMKLIYALCCSVQ
jgi:hypothetical protein